MSPIFSLALGPGKVLPQKVFCGTTASFGDEDRVGAGGSRGRKIDIKSS